ncbi:MULTISPECIES: hypothetical protein [unclassified Burkholderia]|uniref:hypothetical protein n=1 Tax=unclassified Burkholderia TaxID=2613784 RepID=UPI002AAFE138|nr:MULTISPECIES: hypothetical protein [unclassified Burkholderia]
MRTGLAVGMVTPSLSAAAVAHLPPARFGVGSAVNQAIRQMGAVFGVALTVAITGNAIVRLAGFHAVCYLRIALDLATASRARRWIRDRERLPPRRRIHGRVAFSACSRMKFSSKQN